MMPTLPAARRLRAALAAVLVQADAPELALVHRWLDNWRGVALGPVPRVGGAVSPSLRALQVLSGELLA
jgi:hypothetical protein